jgi:ATP-dependent Clp protease adaptor protein ClpS
MDTDTNTIVKKKTVTSQDIKPPRMYKVVIHDDDHTPVDFVITLLINLFRHDPQIAAQITMDVHNKGSAVAGIYTLEIAEQKVVDATQLSRNNGWPLLLNMEPE